MSWAKGEFRVLREAESVRIGDDWLDMSGKVAIRYEFTRRDDTKVAAIILVTNREFDGNPEAAIGRATKKALKSAREDL